MPVCLCDGDVYVLREWGEIARGQILVFFLDGHREDILALYDEDNQYCGIITYKSLLESSDISGAVFREKLFLEDGFWHEAQNLVQNYKDRVIPVFNRNMEMLYFVKYERKLAETWQKLSELRVRVDSVLWKELKYYKKHIHIKGINDVLYYLREWLLSLEVDVSVEGEEWEHFGIEQTICTDENAIVVDKGCKWIDLLFSEYYTQYLRDDVLALEQLLQKTYVDQTEKKDKVMFYISIHSHFVDSIMPLILRYLQSPKKCIVVFPVNAMEWIIYEGRENIRRMVKIIKSIEAAGGACYSGLEPGLYSEKYSVCYLCSEYSGRLPIGLRKASRYVVALQTSALYTHCYRIKGRFEENFSDEAREEIDYLVASEYIAEWICERDQRWDKKILRLGYPKLDKLYNILMGTPEIPEEWKEKVSGKKVFLFTWIDESWMDSLSKEDDVVAIWRPHPVFLATVNGRSSVKNIVNKYDNVIIDNMLSYYVAFKISDALITNQVCSVIVNYLYTEKPVCFYDNNEKYYRQCEVDYRQETWYKSAYIASDGVGVMEFVKMIRNGEDSNKEELAVFRRQVVHDFDGRVCDRIYDYFEK